VAREPVVRDDVDMVGERDMRVLLRELSPELLPGVFVYTSVPRLPERAAPVAMVTEEEGISLVLAQADADRMGLRYQFVAAMISLRVRSALDAVGLSAAVASALAGAGISCNIVAGYHHDHLFVPYERRHEAMAALEPLTRHALASEEREKCPGDRGSGEPASEPGSALREVIPSDYDVLVQLWRVCGIQLPNVNQRLEFERKLERDPELFLVAEDRGEVVGSIMGSYDGRRGWIGRLCVHPDRRRAGLGTRLVREVESRLAAKGCPKVNLLVESANLDAVPFYQRLGYTADDLIFMERWLPGLP
jgi:uncharacterized protein